MTSDRRDPAPGTDFQLVLEGAEIVERDDGLREIVDCDDAHIEPVDGGDDGDE